MTTSTRPNLAAPAAPAAPTAPAPQAATAPDVFEVPDATIDARTPPLLRVTFRLATTRETMAVVIDRYRAWAARGQPFAILIDVNNADRPPPHVHEMISAYIHSPDGEAFTTHCVAVAYVTRSVLIRMAIRAIYFISRTFKSYRVFEDMAEAEAWCRAELAACGGGK